jgi:magnesium chelatase accessory protein
VAIADPARLNFARDHHAWPGSATSRLVNAGGLKWHVQMSGDLAGPRPLALLIHGTGASTHSWRELKPLLADRFTLLALDLPGHGFSETPASRSGMTLPGMAKSISEMLAGLGAKPAVAIGHSAGAAIALRMALDRTIEPKLIVSINGALRPFPGIAGQIFPPMARLLYVNPFVPRFFAWRAENPAIVERLLTGTGSRLDAQGLALYTRLFRDPSHVSGALSMMANWDLEPLSRDLPKLIPHLLLIAAGGDRAIPADDAFKVRDLVPAAEVKYLRGLGHLAHEESPREVAEPILAAAAAQGLV